MAKGGIKVTGMRKVLVRLTREHRRRKRALAGALYQIGLSVIRVSVLLTPVDTNRLRASAFVGPPQIMMLGLAVVLGYGTDYALAVHERPAFHVTGTDGFLRKAMEEETAGYLRHVAQLTRSLYRKNKGADIGDFPTTPKD